MQFKISLVEIIDFADDIHENLTFVDLSVFQLNFLSDFNFQFYAMRLSNLH